MKKTSSILEPSKDLQQVAVLLAKTVRDEMEAFHCEHLTDKQMKELNPLIRNAIYTGLQAMKYYTQSESAKHLVDFNQRGSPEWEEPELTQDFIKAVKRFG